MKMIAALFLALPLIAAFKTEMADAGAEHLVINHPGGKHNFTNPATDRYAK